MLCKKLFKNDDGSPLIISSYQEDVIRRIITNQNDRIIVIAATQSGKSMSIALALILKAVLVPGEEIVNVSATYKQAEIIFDYIRRHLQDNSLISNEVFYKSAFRELSREKITFRNGSYIKILSAGGAGEGETLLGHSASTLVIDESGSIEDVVYKTKILRMLGAERGRKKQLIELGTPHRQNHFSESWNNPAYHKIKVDWKKAVFENRLDEKFVLQQKILLSPLEFSMWYEAEFPEQATDALLNRTSIFNSVNKKFSAGIVKTVLGVDVARYGEDKTILLILSEHEDHNITISNIQVYSKIPTTEIVEHIKETEKLYKYENVYIDDTGVGSGVTDQARTENWGGKVVPVLFGERAWSNPERFSNRKMELADRLRRVFEEGRISIPDDGTLKKQLSELKTKVGSNGKMSLEDPTDYSPDHAHALIIALSGITDNRAGLLDMRGLI